MDGNSWREFEYDACCIHNIADCQNLALLLHPNHPSLLNRRASFQENTCSDLENHEAGVVVQPRVAKSLKTLVHGSEGLIWIHGTVCLEIYSHVCVCCEEYENKRREQTPPQRIMES